MFIYNDTVDLLVCFLPIIVTIDSSVYHERLLSIVSYCHIDYASIVRCIVEPVPSVIAVRMSDSQSR